MKNIHGFNPHVCFNPNLPGIFLTLPNSSCRNKRKHSNLNFSLEINCIHYMSDFRHSVLCVCTYDPFNGLHNDAFSQHVCVCHETVCSLYSVKKYCLNFNHMGEQA